MEMADGQTDLEKSMLEISTILGSYQYKMVFEAMSIENVKKQEKKEQRKGKKVVQDQTPWGSLPFRIRKRKIYPSKKPTKEQLAK